MTAPTQSERDTIESLRKKFEEYPEVKRGFAFYCWLHGWWKPESQEEFFTAMRKS